MTQTFMNYPKSNLMKRALKAPIQLWRLGLGPLVGRKMLLMTHFGRKSRQPRRTLAEYHLLNGKKYVPCAFGARAQWYKNMVADPHVTIQAADGATPARMQRVTDADELVAIATRILKKNPAMMKAHLQALGIRPNPTDIRAKKELLYILRFDEIATTDRTPPPLAADLVWVWPVGLCCLLVGRLLLKRVRLGV